MGSAGCGRAGFTDVGHCSIYGGSDHYFRSICNVPLPSDDLLWVSYEILSYSDYSIFDPTYGAATIPTSSVE